MKYLYQSKSPENLNIVELEEIIDLSKKAIGMINQNELLCLFGTKKLENQNEEFKKYEKYFGFTIRLFFSKTFEELWKLEETG